MLIWPHLNKEMRWSNLYAFPQLSLKIPLFVSKQVRGTTPLATASDLIVFFSKEMIAATDEVLKGAILLIAVLVFLCCSLQDSQYMLY